eukprot:gene30246-37428_t
MHSQPELLNGFAGKYACAALRAAAQFQFQGAAGQLRIAARQRQG